MSVNNLNPNHVAIIMDGNGRWATEKGLDRSEGHIKGYENIKPIVIAAKKLGIKWVGGLKPFRKFKYSLTREQGKLTEIQARMHQGWTMDSKTPQRYYHKDLDNNPEKTKDAVNKFLN